jgi:hypothetical protein
LEGGAIPAKAGTPGPLKIVGITAAAGVCALAAAIFWLADPLFLKSPQDQQLLGKFHDSRAAFEVLRDMVIQDSHHKRYFRISNLDDVSDERRDRYQKLLTEISSGLIVTVDDHATVRFIFAVGGLSAIGPGWSKGRLSR